MAKIELKAQGKTREEAWSKLVKLAKMYPTHKFNMQDVYSKSEQNLFILEIEGELDD